MAKKRAVFDLESAKLIGRVVDQVQHTPSDDGKWPHKRPGTSRNFGFWARITAKEPSGWKYSWRKLEAKDTGKLETNDDYPSGNYGDETLYAVESRYRSKWVLLDSIVWMTPSLTQTYFLFDYVPDNIRHAKLVSASTIQKGTVSAPGKGNVTIRKFDTEAETFSDGEEISIYNSLRTEVKGEAGKELFLHLSYGEGVWWLKGVECEQDEDEEEGEE